MSSPLVHRLTRVGRSPIAVVVGVAGVVVALALAMDRSSYDIWGAFWVAPALFALTVPIVRKITKDTGDPQLGRLLLLAFVAKVLVGTGVRYVMVHGVYGYGDSQRYSEAGKALAPLFRNGIYQDLGKISGTRAIEILTGQVFAGIGPTDLGGFLVFSWLAFVGSLLLVEAFRIAVPNGDHHRYRLLVLFFPTMLFWPSSIGKDACMMLCLGLGAYGVARLLTGQVIGLVPAALGVWGAVVVRPHIGLLLVVAGSLAVAVRTFAPRTEVGGRPHRLRLVLVGAVLVVGVVTVVGQAEQFFGIDSLDPESSESVLTEVVRRTGQGGSEFTATSPNNPVGFAVVFVTVLVRPFPFEAGGGTGLIASAEGMLFAVVIFASLGRVAGLPGAMIRTPYVAMAVAYTLAFVYAFSSIENFGILARQRVQVLPFVFVLLALPRRSDRDDPRQGPTSVQRERIER